MKRSTVLSLIAIVALGFSVGCGKMQGSGASLAAAASTGASSSGGGTGTDVVNQANQDVAAIQQQDAALQQQVATLNNQLSSISLTTLANGSSGGAVAAAQMRSSGPARMRSLQSTIQNLLDNVYKGVSAIYTKVNALQTKVQNQIAALNMNDPAQLAEAVALETALTYLNQEKAKLNGLVTDLVTKVQGVVNSINTKLASLTASNPLYIIADLYWMQIQPSFMSFENELTALTQ